jgi:hypothetical protein
MPKQLGAHILVAGVAIPAPAAAAGTQRVTVTVGNAMRFARPAAVVRAGQPVELTLRNGGGIPHDVTLAGGASGPATIAARRDRPLRRGTAAPPHRRPRDCDRRR